MRRILAFSCYFFTITLTWASYADLQVYQTYAGELDDFETNVSHHNPARAEKLENFALTSRPRLAYSRFEGSGINKFSSFLQTNYFDTWFSNLGVYAGVGLALLQNNSQEVTQGANNYALALSISLLPGLRIGAGSRLAFGLGNNADAGDGSLRARGGLLYGPEKGRWQIGYTAHFYADIADFNAYISKYDTGHRFNYDTDIANQSFLHKFSFRLRHGAALRSHILLSTYLQTQDNDFFISTSYFLQYQGLINWHSGLRLTRKRFKSSFSDDDTSINWLVGVHFRPFSILSLKAGLSLLSYENNLLGGSTNQVRSKTFLFLGSLPNLGFNFHFAESLNLEMNLSEQIIRVSDIANNSTEIKVTGQINYRLPAITTKTIWQNKSG